MTRTTRCRLSKLAPLVCLPLLAACDGGFGGKLDPVIATSIGPEVHALATGANRRLVVTAKVREDDDSEALVICAEPSPDAIEALAASVNASLDARDGERSLEAERASAITTAASGLLKRSQGLQFYRDGIFALCQASMNGLRRKEDVRALALAYQELQKDAKELILAEIRSQGWNSVGTPAVAAPAHAKGN